MLFHSLGASIRKKNGSDTPHQTTMNKLCRESVARCRECLTHPFPVPAQTPIRTTLANTLKFHHCSPWYFSILVHRKIKLSRPITHRGFFGPRATWRLRSYFEVNISTFLVYVTGGRFASADRTQTDSSRDQPSLVVPHSRLLMRPGLVSYCFCTNAICMPRRR